MFENLKKEENKIDDIFAETDKAEDSVSSKSSNLEEKPGVSSAGQPLMSKPDINDNQVEKKNTEDFSDFSDKDDKKGKILKKFFVVIIILAIIGVIAYFVYSKILVPQTLNNNMENNDMEDLIDSSDVDLPPIVDLIEEEEEEEPLTDIDQEQEESEKNERDALKRIDSDGDGLSDYDEIYNYFTDIFSPDSDNDNLTDYEEVFVTNTDPLSPDSDGDGYLDGQEIMSCYNPLGDGDIDINLFVDPEYFSEIFPEVMEKCNLILQ